MNQNFCQNQITYTIRAGDTLFRIAAFYHTTVADILRLNPGIDPQNLQIGSTIQVCVGEEFFAPPPAFPRPPIGTLPPAPPAPPMPAPPIEPAPPILPLPPTFPVCPPCPPCPPSSSCPYCKKMSPVRAGNMPSMPPAELRPLMNTVQSCTNGNCAKKLDLKNNMRLVWEQHAYWTRMVLIGIADRLKDQAATQARLLQNPADISAIFERYFGAAAADKIARLLTEHLQIGAQIMTALRDGKTAEAEKLQNQWYENAYKMADAFETLGFNREEISDMLQMHLELTTQEVASRLAEKYADDIKSFDKVEQEALNMADFFSKGIISQFPNKF